MAAISTQPSWRLTLDLVTTSNQPRGSLVVYRIYRRRDLQLDVNLLTSEFPALFADALERVLTAPDAWSGGAIRLTPAGRESLTSRMEHLQEVCGKSPRESLRLLFAPCLRSRVRMRPRWIGAFADCRIGTAGLPQGERRLSVRQKLNTPVYASFNGPQTGMVVDLSELLDLHEHRVRRPRPASAWK